MNKKELEDSVYKTINIIDRDTLTISILTEYSFNEKTKEKNKLKKENEINVTWQNKSKQLINMISFLIIKNKYINIFLLI